MLKLYHITRTDPVDRLHDYYDSCVVAASSPANARKISIKHMSSDHDLVAWPHDHQHLHVKHIGTSKKGLVPDLIIASFSEF